MNIKKYIEAEQALGTDIYNLAVLTSDIKLLEALVKHKDSVLRWCVARNPNATVEILNLLIKDKVEWVRGRADQVLSKRVKDDGSKRIH